MSGGGARSALWREIVASVLDLPLELTAVEEGAACGAALLAGCRSGAFADPQRLQSRAACECSRERNRSRAWVAAYAAGYGALHQAVSDAALVVRLGVEAALVDGRLVTGDVEIADGRIASVGLGGAGSGIAVPGFLDLHVHGFGGVDFASADTEGYRRATEALFETGVTSFQPTFVTAPEDELVASLREVPLVGAGLSSRRAVPVTGSAGHASGERSSRPRRRPARAKRSQPVRSRT